MFLPAIMNRILTLGFLIAICASVHAQPATPSPTPAPVRTRPATPFDPAEYGVAVRPDARLIIVMAALDAAGFDPTPGKEPSAFRKLIRKDQANLDANLRERLTAFYQRDKLPAPATPADEAARYVSLAYALGQPPLLDAPARSEDLPSGVLEVLDFAPLVREFYGKSGMDERLVGY